MKIRIDMGGNEITATLTDNATSRDFVSLLPLKLKLEDYGDTEKIGYLPRKLHGGGAARERSLDWGCKLLRPVG
jgi:hypothetical protein